MSKAFPSRDTSADSSPSKANRPTGAAAARSPCDLPVDDGRAIIVTGSLSSNPADRWLPREKVVPVQIILDGMVQPAAFFNEIGDFGISAFAFTDPEDPAAPIYFSSGSDLWQIQSGVRPQAAQDPSAFVDSHELNYFRDRIAIANTGRDEILLFSPNSGELDRISLRPFRQLANGPDEQSTVVDHFHVNQAFLGLDGDLWALVHHTHGRQFTRRLLGKQIKCHGDGGVLNLDRNVAIDLALVAPHSVRVVRGEYWLMNSGCSKVGVYSPDWKFLRSFPSMGWGRGLAISGGYAYAGISPIRRRYRILSQSAASQPHIQVLDVATGQSVACTVLRNIEQVNNVYCVSRATAMALMDLT